MAVRVTAAEVKAIMDNISLTDPIIEAYIGSANVFVNTILGTTETATLKECERWITAHMIASTSERQAKKEGADGAFIEYTGIWDEGLRGTSYGQMAICMDTTGKLASLGKKVASITAIKSFN